MVTAGRCGNSRIDHPKPARSADVDLVSVLEVPHRPTAGPDAVTGVGDGPRSDPTERWGTGADVPTASPVWWPSPPSTLRRMAAWVVDVVVIVGASLAVALTQARTFQPAGGLSPRHRALLDRVEESRSVVVTTGDTVRTWSGAGLWITVTSFALIALIVLALLPANLGGRTPGMAAARLRVIATAGTPARL
ncbi:MAG: RDD family protein, partial [Acidimicrobiia bacterium]|nr:RDD family protein [Acidimicrobiia bacterium]